MEVIEEKQDAVYIFRLLGRLDSNTSPAFEKKIISAIEEGESTVVVDFESLDYISSAGLRVLLKAAKQLKKSEGRIHLCSMKDYIKEVFDIAGFTTFLPVYSSLDDAVKEMANPGR